MASVPSASTWPVSASDVDEGVGAGRGRRVELVDEVRDGLVGPVAVVLDLVDADDVGVHREDGRDRLGPLPVELGLGVGAAAVGQRALGAEAAGVLVSGSPSKVLK